MIPKKLILGLVVLCSSLNFSQEKNATEKLDSIIIYSTRIDLPFKKNSRTIQIVTAADIKNSAATNVADLLQQVAGVDIRRRGTAGSQADLFIRGGGFDQTLLLIDGIKMDDAQTGHHTMNAALPIEVIERIEIIKGPAARIFGQNAFTGAINIVTKKNLDKQISVNIEGGSFQQLNASVTAQINSENTSHMIHVGALTSDGYRNNSDYNNYNYFLKSTFNKNKQPIHMVATFFDKKFGAENFYTTNPTFNEYEETQNSLIGLYTTINSGNFKIKPRLYWRRGQDIFLLRRNDPSFYRNLHITNKVGFETNVSYRSALGETGLGIDLARVSIASNNLGKRQRFMGNLFVEHRFAIGESIDITPGLAVAYFSDFKFHAFPGIDLGVNLVKNLRYYWNFGTTYRIPTYTDLFYNDPITSGNPNLEPERAIAQEMGFKYSNNNLFMAIAVFNRDSSNLIDYIRPSTTQSVFSATNIAKVNTKGVDLDVKYSFDVNGYSQNLSIGYSFLKDDILDQNKDLSRYSLNTLRHQFITRWTSQFFKNVTQNIIYKHGERSNGQIYNVVDASMIMNFNQFDVTITANNIFDAEYIEAGFVPMPPSNVLFGLRYSY